MNAHRIEIGEDVYSRNTTGTNALRRKPRIALSIALWSIAPIMGFPINLDSKMMARAEKIEDVVARRMLAAKLQTCRVLAKFPP